MRTKRLGGDRLEVPVVGLRCMVMPEFYGPGREEQAIAGLDAAIPPGAAPDTRNRAAQMAAVHR